MRFSLQGVVEGLLDYQASVQTAINKRPRSQCRARGAGDAQCRPGEAPPGATGRHVGQTPGHQAAKRTSVALQSSTLVTNSRAR